jgi:hypothetical protein
LVHCFFGGGTNEPSTKTIPILPRFVNCEQGVL